MSEPMTKERAEGSSVAPTGGRATAVQSPADATWYNLDQRVYACIKIWVDQWWEAEKRSILEATGEVFGEHRASIRTTTTGLSERVARLETASQYEARYAKLAYEAKCGPPTLEATEVQHRELLTRIDTLQRELDELKRIAAQPGPQGPPGPPGKLPRVRDYVAERVHYETDVVTHAGALWQAQCDTVHAPPHNDWTCLARSGRDAITPNVCGTFNTYDRYKKLDIVVSDGAAFIAKRDNPGICPGEGWQLMSRQGRQGRKGEPGERGRRGEKGDKGEPGTTLRSWQFDRERYRFSPLMTDGKVGPMLELQPMLEHFLNEVGGGVER